MGDALRIGIITAYLNEDWHSQQLVRATGKYGDAVVISPESLGARLTSDGVSLLAAGLDIESLDGFILARGFGERGNADFLIPVYKLLQQNGKTLVNNIDALMTAIDKFETSCLLQQAGVPTPAVVVVQEVSMAEEVLGNWRKLVAKPLFGSLGLGIRVLEDTEEGHAALPELIDKYGAIYMQEFVPTPGRDIRAFVVGDKVAAGMYRIATDGGWINNVSRGARTEPCELDDNIAEMAVTAARAVGLDYTGVDILEGPEGPLVIEVNGNPLWQGLQNTTGLDMADEILRWVVERIEMTTAKGGERIA